MGRLWDSMSMGMVVLLVWVPESAEVVDVDDGGMVVWSEGCGRGWGPVNCLGSMCHRPDGGGCCSRVLSLIFIIACSCDVVTLGGWLWCVIGVRDAGWEVFSVWVDVSLVLGVVWTLRSMQSIVSAFFCQGGAFVVWWLHLNGSTPAFGAVAGL